MPTPVETAPAFFAAAPIIALVALIALVVALCAQRLRHEEPLIPGIIAWPLPFAVLLGVSAYWSVAGMYTGDLATIVSYSAAMFAFGALTVLRKPLFAWIDTHGLFVGTVLRTLRDAIILITTACLSAWAIDLAWNPDYGLIPIQFFFTSTVFALVVLIALYLLGQRTGILCLIVPLVFVGFGIAQHFVLSFKGAAILPSDLLSLRTAAAVSESYEFTFDGVILQAILVGGACILLLSLIWPGRAQTNRARAINVAANLFFGVVICAATLGFLNTTRLTDLLSFDYDHWMPITTYREKGFACSFVSMVQDLRIEAPQDYSDQNTQQLQGELAARYDNGAGAAPERAEAVAQFDQAKPTIIAVMNESFADLSAYEPLYAAGYTGPAFFNSMADTLQRGTLATSVFGGGTANTEFEFLTNSSIAFAGGKVMYQLYDFSQVDSLPKQLKNAGYETHAIHPQLATNYNRSNVYRQLGFDEFHDIDEFANVPMYHNWVSDRATYDKILQIIAQSDTPQFIFDVTMQNHGGYNTGGIPEEDITSYAPEGITDADELSEINTYLSCITAADRDLAYFIDELKQLDRPVVLVFFGDHQPSVSSYLVDTYYADEDDLARRTRAFHTSYIMWANYDVAGNEQLSANQPIGANALSAQLLHLVGAPLTEYQKALLSVRDSIPAFSGAGYYTADGSTHDVWEQNDTVTLVDAMQRMQYLNLVEKVQ